MSDIERPSDVDVVLPGSTSRLHSDMADFSSKSPDDDVGTVRLVGSAQPSEDELGGNERVVIANDPSQPEGNDYAGNRIVTSKYNILTFLPKNLFEQFQRVANVYFLFLLILQLVPQISSLNPVTTAVPLVFVLGVTAVKDAYDDFLRHRSDDEINHRDTFVLRNKSFVTVVWEKVKVGEIIKVKNNDFITADLLVLSSSEENNLCYVETAELDGETNLKVRQAIPETAELGDNENNLGEFDGEVKCETPNNKLDKFDGRLEWKNNKYSLNNNNLLLRGCRLRNTNTVYGLVIFAGHDTKLMQNAGDTSLKRTGIDRLMNWLVIMVTINLYSISLCQLALFMLDALFQIFGCLATLAIICSIAESIWERGTGDAFQWYVPWEDGLDSPTIIASLQFFSYIIVMNTLVPISLYVSVEIIRLGLSWLVDWDVEMYDKESDTPAKARTTTLNEELGQIQYIFSDKTGTLTQNVMTFHMCSIGGDLYGRKPNAPRLSGSEETIKLDGRVDFSSNEYADQDFEFYDASLVSDCRTKQEVIDFFRLIGLCHTVMPEKNGTTKRPQYQAQSPDEGALVGAAANFGIAFIERTPSVVTLNVNGKNEQYQVLCILDFDNVRKRMSIVVRGPSPTDRIRLLCKGADNMILDRLASGQDDKRKETLEHLKGFGSEGLRTLCLGAKDLTESEWDAWNKKYHVASTTTQNRDEKLRDVYEEIETDMTLLGATAVEDKLQDGVPSTIARLASASIKIWVLTGDKEETAINIGFSCRLLTNEMKEVFVVEGRDVESVTCSLTHLNEMIKSSLREYRGLRDDDEVDFVDGKVHTSGLEPRESVNCVDLPDGEINKEPEFALVINGFSLSPALHERVEDLFVKTACMCKAVICCRVTPLQKALVVELVKKHKEAITLAIGDGANDVSMIKAAHIGVGISGKEGRQAVLASDYSLAQFRFLERLLLVHGRWSYMRMCKFLRYFFYKNFAFSFAQFFYAWFCGFTAQTVYDAWFITFYNVIFTSLPVLVLGILDQDVDEATCLRYPKLYVPGQQNRLFNVKVFLLSLFNAIVVSTFLYFFAYEAFYLSVDGDGKDAATLDVFQTTLAGCLVLAVNLQCGLDTYYWTAVNHVFIWGSILVWYLFIFVLYGERGLNFYLPAAFPAGAVAPFTLNLPIFWLSVLLIAAVSLVPLMTVRYLSNVWSPTLIDVVRKQRGSECCECHGIAIRQSKKRLEEDEERPGRATPSQLGRDDTKLSVTGFAFSQEPGFGDLIQSGRLSYVETRHPKSSLSSDRLPVERIVMPPDKSPTHDGDSIHPEST
ncbi:phospholipid-transporting ATPase ID-like isoform X2 [Corticium candelabrum]|uniref:phospholipid-transporting ATPase ID-like isoform X2 n=1 Tax=Corticium candelabrum TaxID=121492 RepID=UPI002E25BDE2|nr:phospholipid-transporting ATPase ID-like isoform X2 [Corticium candelabrum]